MKKKFLLSFIISFLCFAVMFMTVGEKFLLKNNSTALMDNGNEGETELNNNDTVKNEILFLFMGIADQNGVAKTKEKKVQGQNKYKPTGNLSDTMMLCKVNFDTGKIDILSIPRDTRVKINGIKNQTKINAAYSKGGPYLAVDTVRDLLNIDLNYYVAVDYQAVMKIVDAIGGVKIDVPRDMKYSDPTDKPPLNINIKKGPQVLDGKTAIGFLRWRKNNNMTSGYSDGDVGRIKVQQMFMEELIKQTLKPKNILKLPTLIGTYFEYVDTNIPMNKILQGAKMAKKIDANNITTEIIPGEGEYIGPTSYYIYDKTKMESLVKTMFSDYLLGK